MFDMFAVCLDGLDTQAKCRRDLAGGLAFSQKLKNFKLSVTERVDGRLKSLARSAHTDQLAEQFLGHPVTEVNLAVQNDSDRLKQGLRRGLLCHITPQDVLVPVPCRTAPLVKI